MRQRIGQQFSPTGEYAVRIEEKSWCTLEPRIIIILGVTPGALGESLREHNIEYKANWEDENYQWVSLPSHKN
jgi:hypothetical protein